MIKDIYNKLLILFGFRVICKDYKLVTVDKSSSEKDLPHRITILGEVGKDNIN